MRTLALAVLCVLIAVGCGDDAEPLSMMQCRSLDKDFAYKVGQFGSFVEMTGEQLQRAETLPQTADPVPESPTPTARGATKTYGEVMETTVAHLFSMALLHYNDWDGFADTFAQGCRHHDAYDGAELDVLVADVRLAHQEFIEACQMHRWDLYGFDC